MRHIQHNFQIVKQNILVGMSMNPSMHKQRPCSQAQVVECYITSCGANVTTTRPEPLYQV